MKAMVSGRSTWSMGKIKRLLHATTTNDVKVAYANQYSANSREQLDARRSELCELTVFESLLDKLNDRSYNPTSNIIPDLHYSFSEPRDLLYNGCMNGMDVTADQCKENLLIYV